MKVEVSENFLGSAKKMTKKKTPLIKEEYNVSVNHALCDGYAEVWDGTMLYSTWRKTTETDWK